MKKKKENIGIDKFIDKLIDEGFAVSWILTGQDIITGPKEVKPEPGKKTNIASVGFIRTDEERFKIVEFRNFKTLKEIKNKYGKEVADKYVNCECHMLKLTSRDILSEEIFINVRGKMAKIKIGNVFSPNGFDKVTDTMKEAGTNLSNIIKSKRNPKPVTKYIEI